MKELRLELACIKQSMLDVAESERGAQPVRVEAANDPADDLRFRDASLDGMRIRDRFDRITISGRTRKVKNVHDLWPPSIGVLSAPVSFTMEPGHLESQGVAMRQTDGHAD
jgi:hypothetical protein